MHCFSVSPKNPQGHGFIVAISIKSAGNLNFPFARLMVISRSSSGCRSDSSIDRALTSSSVERETPAPFVPGASASSPKRRMLKRC